MNTKKTTDLPVAYTEQLQTLAQQARHSPYRGPLAQPTLQGQFTNPSCGDSIHFMVQVTDGVVTCIRFQASGCLLSQAAADRIAAYADQRPLRALAALSDEQAIEFIGLTVGINRRQCITFIAEAIRKLAAPPLSQRTSST